LTVTSDAAEGEEGETEQKEEKKKWVSIVFVQKLEELSL
jgi:hypothetical protein